MRHFVACVMTICIFVGSAFSQAGDWATIKGLNIGDDIWIKTKQGKKYQGQFDSADPEKVILWSNERSFPGRVVVKREIARIDVQEVKRIHRWVSTGVGATIGAGIGVGLGAAIDARARSNEDTGIAGVVFGLLGGALGALLAKTHPFIKSASIYTAP
jgi:hypothetical protein